MSTSLHIATSTDAPDPARRLPKLSAKPEFDEIPHEIKVIIEFLAKQQALEDHAASFDPEPQ